jgi:ribonuclease P protein subunit POP4
MTPESLVRHELAGLDVAVADSPNPDLVGLAGRVVDETMHTLLVATSDGVKQVPKADATFRFEVEESEALRASDSRAAQPRDDGETVSVLVDGERLVARPARRTETNGATLWQ